MSTIIIRDLGVGSFERCADLLCIADTTVVDMVIEPEIGSPAPSYVTAHEGGTPISDAAAPDLRAFGLGAGLDAPDPSTVSDSPEWVPLELEAPLAPVPVVPSPLAQSQTGTVPTTSQWAKSSMSSSESTDSADATASVSTHYSDAHSHMEMVPEGALPLADSHETATVRSPPPLNHDEFYAERRNERRYRMLLKHEFHPSRTFSSSSLALILMLIEHDFQQSYSHSGHPGPWLSAPSASTRARTASSSRCSTPSGPTRLQPAACAISRPCSRTAKSNRACRASTSGRLRRRLRTRWRDGSVRARRLLETPRRRRLGREVRIREFASELEPEFVS